MTEQSERQERIAELDREIATSERELWNARGSYTDHLLRLIESNRAERSRLSESGTVPESGPLDCDTLWIAALNGDREAYRAEYERMRSAASVPAAPQADSVRVIQVGKDVETVASVRRAIKEAWLVDGEKTDFDADRLALAAIAALSQSPIAPGLVAAADHLTASADQINRQINNLRLVGTDECLEQAAELDIIEPCLRAEANYLRSLSASDRREESR